MSDIQEKILSVRTTVPKNTTNFRMTLANVPKRYAASSLDYVDGFKMATTVLNQVQYVEKLFLNAKDSVETMEFLAHVLFNTVVGHPVRNKLTKLFETRAGKKTLNEEIIFTALKKCLAYMFVEFDISWDHDKLNEFIVSISACCNNFTFGLRALFFLASKFTQVVILTVVNFINVIRSKLPSDHLNTYYVYLQNALRTLITCMQLFDQPHAYYANINETVFVCTNFYRHTDMPFDLRSNVATFLILISRKVKVYNQLLKDILATKNIIQIPYIIRVFIIYDINEYIENSEIFLKIGKTLVEIAQEFVALPNVLMSIARSFYQHVKSMLSLPADVAVRIKVNTKLMLRQLCLFAVTYAEYRLKAVRLLCANIVRVALLVSKNLDFMSLSDKLYNSYASKSMQSSVKCMLLQQIILAFGIKSTLQRFPNFRNNLFEGELTKGPAFNSLYECIMVESHACHEYNVWIDLWINKLLEIARCDDELYPNIELLIMRAIKIDENVVNVILKSKDVTLKMKLLVIWSLNKKTTTTAATAATAAIADNAKKLNFKYFQIKDHEIENALCSSNRELSFFILRLIVETQLTDETTLNQLQYKYIALYINNHSNYADADKTQKIYNVLRKFLMGLKVQLIKLHKAEKNIQESKIFMQFQNLTKLLNEQLFLSANYGRRWIALHLLQDSLNICNIINLKCTIIIPKATVKQLYLLLADPRKSIKNVAIEILKCLHDQLDSLAILPEVYELNLNVINALNLLISTNSSHTMTAAYQLELFSHCCEMEEFMKYGIIDGISENLSMQYVMLRWYIIEIYVGVMQSKSNFYRAIIYNPLNGVLFAVRRLFRQVDAQKLLQQDLWRSALEDLIWLMVRFLDIILPFLNNQNSEDGVSEIESQRDNSNFAAVEGFEYLCAILEQGVELKLANMNFIPNAIELFMLRYFKIDTIKSQLTMELINNYIRCTINELCLLFVIIIKIICNDIAAKSGDDTNGMIKFELPLIGEHLQSLLFDIKYHPAIQSVYVLFRKICEHLWCDNDSDLSCIPYEWFRILKDKIKNLNVSITEDASTAREYNKNLTLLGVILIQSEFKAGTKKCLKEIFNITFGICADNQTSNNEATLIIAKNIISSLFDTTSLNKHI